MIHELTAFIGQCLASGVALSSLCALIIIPIAAWIAVRPTAALIRRMDADPMWQAPLAATAAVLPGLLFLALAAFGLAGGIQSMCFQFAGGRLLFSVLGIVTILGVTRALVMAARRLAHGHALFAASHEPSARLAQIGGQCDVSVRECDDHELLCMLVNVVRPVVLVSTGTLARLDDDELRAALLHEHAHAASGDQRIALILSFFIDALPLPAHGLVAVYRRARELAADQRALKRTTTNHLASALITMARSGHPIPSTAAFAERHGVLARLEALLQHPDRVARRRYRVAVCLLLTLIAVGGIGTPIVSNVLLSCARAMNMSA